MATANFSTVVQTYTDLRLHYWRRAGKGLTVNRLETGDSLR